MNCYPNFKQCERGRKEMRKTCTFFLQRWQNLELDLLGEYVTWKLTCWKVLWKKKITQVTLPRINNHSQALCWRPEWNVIPKVFLSVQACMWICHPPSPGACFQAQSPWLEGNWFVVINQLIIHGCVSPPGPAQVNDSNLASGKKKKKECIYAWSAQNETLINSSG